MQVDHEAAVAVLKEQLAAAEKCAEDVAADMQDKLKAAQVRLSAETTVVKHISA